MFNWIKKQFGEGVIRANFTCTDGSQGVLKIPYIGDINTLDWTEMTQEMSNQMLVKHGKRIKSLTYVGHT